MEQDLDGRQRVKEMERMWNKGNSRAENHMGYIGTEMKFLDINFTKVSSLLLHAIHSPFYWRILKKNHTLLWFKNLEDKKTRV